MPRGFEAQWRAEGKKLQPIVEIAGREVVDQIEQLTPGALDLVLEDLRELRETAGKNPRELIEALPALIKTHQHILGGAENEPNERLVFSSGPGKGMNDAEFANLIQGRITRLERDLRRARKPARPAG